MKVYAYEGCSTCRKALSYLKSTGREFQLIPIRETPPTKDELRRMLKLYQGKVKHLFNTSGQDYRAMGLGAKLPKLTDEQAITLLSKHGNLVKRPFVLVGNTGAVGFKEEEWLDKGLRQLPKGL